MDSEHRFTVSIGPPIMPEDPIAGGSHEEIQLTTLADIRDDDDDEEKEEHPAPADFCTPPCYTYDRRDNLSDTFSTTNSPYSFEIAQRVVLPLRKKGRHRTYHIEGTTILHSIGGPFYGFVDMVVVPPQIGGRSTSMYGIMEDAQDDRSLLRARVNLLYRDRPVHRRLAPLCIIGLFPASRTRIDLLFCLATQDRSFVQAMINEGITAALAARDATRNGDDSHTSGTGARRPVQVARECTYPDFLKCQPLNFKGTEGVVGLTQWFEKMESVY
ncbi:hypothetical protein Tco_1515721 [Tanacetum coccineum]